MEFQTEKIHKIDAKLLSMTVIDGALKFYENPKNVAAFKKWQKERNQKRA